jgi:methylmalonyl-CoA mutase N-terminal domain/subunit
LAFSHEPIFRERVKKGPENPISVVADQAAARGANPAHDRSFWQRGALAAGWHALIRLPGGTKR